MACKTESNAKEGLEWRGPHCPRFLPLYKEEMGMSVSEGPSLGDVLTCWAFFFTFNKIVINLHAVEKLENTFLFLFVSPLRPCPPPYLPC